MTETDWIAFLAAAPPHPISVGRLDRDLQRHLRASTDLIQVLHPYIVKIVTKHRLGPQHLALLSTTIEQGCAIDDRTGHITFFYLDRVQQCSWYQATIKTAAEGRELWVCTFHRQNPREVARNSAKYPILRAGRGGVD